MNGKQRAKMAFAHQEADRVPVFELTIDNPTAAHVLGRETLCGFGGMVRGVKQNQALISGKNQEFQQQRTTDHIELWKALDIDVFPECMPVSINPSIPEQIDQHTWRFEDSPGMWSICRYVPESDTYDQVDSYLRVGGLAALEKLTSLLESSKPNLDGLDFSYVERILSELGGDHMVLGLADVQIGSTMDWAETFLIAMVEAPDLVERYLDARLESTLLVAEELLKRGVDGLQGGYDWASGAGPIFSPRHFRKFVFPRLKKITDLCHQYGGVYVKHTDGNVNSLLEDMIAAGVDAFHAIEPRAGMDIGSIKQKYGDQLTLIGNVDCSTVLVDGPVEAVQEATKAVIRSAAKDGGFLLSSSNSIHPGVKPEYYLAMLDTARNYGVYPINEKGG